MASDDLHGPKAYCSASQFQQVHCFLCSLMVALSNAFLSKSRDGHLGFLGAFRVFNGYNSQQNGMVESMSMCM